MAVTRMGYESELAAAEVILRELQGTHAEAVARLGLAPFVGRLEELLPQFREALRDEDVREVEYSQVREARGAGNEKLLQVRAGASPTPRATWTRCCSRTATTITSARCRCCSKAASIAPSWPPAPASTSPTCVDALRDLLIALEDERLAEGSCASAIP